MFLTVRNDKITTNYQNVPEKKTIFFFKILIMEKALKISQNFKN